MSEPTATPRIDRESLQRAVKSVRLLKETEKSDLLEQMQAEQPELLAATMACVPLGVSLAKVDFLIVLNLIAFQAMRNSGHNWPQITADDQARQAANYVPTVRLAQGIGVEELPRPVGGHYLSGYPEPWLLEYIHNELIKWLNRIDQEESDELILRAAINMVNCVAWSEM